MSLSLSLNKPRARSTSIDKRSPLIERLETRTLFSTLPSGFIETQLATGLNNPTSMAIAPDGRVFVCQQTGDLRVIKDGKLLTTPFVHVPAQFSSERGLVGVVLSPTFATDNYVYLYYTYRENSTTIYNQIKRYTANGDVATSSTGTLIFKLDNLDPNAPVHNGGSMAFGPDGKLYVGVGDNGITTAAQSLTTVFGKVLRLNPDGSIPTDNPFYSQTTGNERAIYARGLRNPFSLTIQAGTGKIFVGEVGEDTWEEVDSITAGSNYGWPVAEGNSTNTAFVNPVYEYHHGTSLSLGKAITGAAFYNPATVSFPSSYTGKFFFADYASGWINTFDPSNPYGTVSNFASGLILPVNLKVGADGSLYYLQQGSQLTSSSTTGALFKISYSASVVKPSITDQPDDLTVGAGQSATFIVAASGTGPLTYQWRRNGTAITGATAISYTLAGTMLTDSGATFDVVVTNKAGNATSTAAKLTVTSNHAPVPVITSPKVSDLFTAGVPVTFTGTATDVEDGTLPGSSLLWTIQYYTDDVPRPFLTTSGTSGTFTAPAITPYLRTNVFMRITLEAKDSAGLVTDVTQDMQPLVSTFTLASNVPGVTLTLDGHPDVAPIVTEGVVGEIRPIVAPSPQTINGVTYVFDHWSDGGAATHDTTTPAANTTFTAYYVQSTATTVPGLLGTYYDNIDFTGKSFTRIDPTVNFYWGDDAPASTFGKDTFSIRWTGFVTPKFSEEYTIIARADDGVRVWVNNHLVVDAYTDHAIADFTSKITLAAGQSYAIRTDYYDHDGKAGARLFWSSKSTPRNIIPATALSTPSAATTSIVAQPAVEVAALSTSVINATDPRKNPTAADVVDSVVTKD